MARQQVLSTIPQNQVRGIHNNSKAVNSKKNQQHTIPAQHNNKMRSASLSSLSSVSSIASSSRDRLSPKAVLSPSASPDENKARKERKHFVEMFSPVRAIRAARAGMKRKRGGGTLALAPNRNSAALQRSLNHNRSTIVEGKRPAAEEKRMIRRSRRTESRDASLHSGMKAMVLTDNDSEAVARPIDANNRRISGTGSVRSTRYRLQHKGREDSEDEVADDAEEGKQELAQISKGFMLIITTLFRRKTSSASSFLATTSSEEDKAVQIACHVGHLAARRGGGSRPI